MDELFNNVFGYLEHLKTVLKSSTATEKGTAFNPGNRKGCCGRFLWRPEKKKKQVFLLNLFERI